MITFDGKGGGSSMRVREIGDEEGVRG